MLLRAAGRRQARRPLSKLATDLEYLHLPRSRFAQSRWNTTHARTPSEGRRAALAAHQEPTPIRTRSLTSFAGYADHLDDSPPYPHAYDGPPPDFHWHQPAGAPSEPLMLSFDRDQPVTRRGALGNSSADLLQNLYACIRVGRFDRSETIVKRLSLLDEASSADVMHAHETYLNARLQYLASPPGFSHNFKAMQTWFAKNHLEEKDNVEAACAIMMRAAMMTCTGPELNQQVRNYADISGMSDQELLDDELWDVPEKRILEAVFDHKPVKLDDLKDVTPDVSSQQLETDDQYHLSESDIPEILQVDQRGLSLPSLKSTLKLYAQESVVSDPEETIESRKVRNYERERMLENHASETALERWRVEEQQLQAMGIKSSLSNRTINALMWDWYSTLVPQLRQVLDEIKARTSTINRRNDMKMEEMDFYGVYIEPLTAEKLALTTVIYVMSTLTQEKDRRTDEYMGIIRVADAAKQLGNRIEDETVADLARKQANADKSRKRKRGISHLAMARANLRRSSTKATMADHVDWPLKAKVQIGAMLITKFLDVAKMPITREHPRTKEKITKIRSAFAHKVVYLRGKRQGIITACLDLREKIRKEPPGAVISKRLPMLVEPEPWTGFKSGGYITHPTTFIRLAPSDRTPKDYAMSAIDQGHMTQVFDAINALSKIPWKINEAVLRVQIEAWNTGEAVGNFAPLDPQYEYPPEPPKSPDPHVRSRWIMEVQELDNKKSGLHSQRCHQNLQLEIARAFRNDTIYFPHNVDFRGRAYPIPPYLNHMGADNVRALMLFGQGKELGENGLRWLKIHLANVFGYDKASFSEREEFVMNHLDDIYDSAEKPLTGRKWWMESEDSWQTLAACVELKAALESPDSTRFVSHLPTQQDGTCNGLQHYAALGGDEVGARQVNLLPGDRPSDVYTAVAEGVIASVKKDLEAGNPIAHILDGRITRKVVKQPVMTNVYGVTYFGARAQVKKQLEDIFPEIKTGDLINHRTLAAYIARKIFNSLGEMFRGAQAIQEWLGKCADRIATSVTPEQMDAIKSSAHSTKASKKKSTKTKAQFKSTVIWTTPLRFPVVQPYRESAAKSLQTSLSSIFITEPHVWDPVSRRKQMQGFPPNFIHSLDATHMMLSAIKCEEKGITFASIHDSFWTHACDRDELSGLLRDAFVHMHKEDVVGRLREEFMTRHKGCMYLQSIDSKSDVGRRIKEWRTSEEGQELLEEYGKGLAPTEKEMMVERERQKLLDSEDPEQQEKGRSMITPASLFLAEGDEGAMSAPLGIANSRLGHALEDGEEAEMEAISDGALDEPDHEAAAAPRDADVEDGQRSSDDKEEAKTDAEVNEAEFREKWLGGDSAGRKTFKDYKVKTTVWLPLTFPAVPKKGGFDVRRLKESKYFFH